ncbi:DUF4293 domain-containing protein [candidate division KSB1 bacterium]
MIQRIQSLFLLLVMFAMTAFFFFPIASYIDIINNKYYKFSILGLKHISPDPEPIVSSFFTIPLAIITIAIFVLALTALFSYKKRKHQVKLCRMNMFVNIILLLLIFFFYAPSIEKYTNDSTDYLGEAGIYFPLISIIFLLLAIRSIIRDEKLIRSADRLR